MSAESLLREAEELERKGQLPFSNAGYGSDGESGSDAEAGSDTCDGAASVHPGSLNTGSYDLQIDGEVEMSSYDIPAIPRPSGKSDSKWETDSEFKTYQPEMVNLGFGPSSVSSKREGFSLGNSRANKPLSAPGPSKEAQLRKVQMLLLENRRLKKRQQCRLCHEKQVSITFLPCGHYSYCYDCGQQFTACPICKKTILADVRTFLA